MERKLSRLDLLEQDVSVLKRAMGLNQISLHHGLEGQGRQLNTEITKGTERDERISATETTTNDIVLLMADLVGGE